MSWSVLLAAVLTGASGLVASLIGAWYGALGILVVSAGYLSLYLLVRGRSERIQTDIVATVFDVGYWATFLNGVFALDILFLL
ncbi:hypothetical protein [Halopelagius fulvigenes]|uniref:Uncharacterized protein n=1 Tax=Halopelagius fulvigenes TaxID=1198324 RepID=A0ABD5TUZ6_9EURY